MIIERTPHRDLLFVLAIWIILLGGAVSVLWMFNRNSVQLINRIEYLEVGRYGRVLALYEEAQKRAEITLGKLDNAPGTRLDASDTDYAAAVDLYRRALELDPRGEISPRHTEYYGVLTRLHEAAGEEWKALTAAVRLALSRTDLESARQRAHRLLNVAPKEAEAWRWAAEVALRSGELDEATSAVASMEAIAKTDQASAHELLARISESRRDYKAAIREYEQVLRHRPRDIDIRKRLSELLDQQGSPDSALSVLLSGVELGGNSDGNYMHRLGEALLRSNQPANAVSVLEDAAELDPNSAEVFWSLARAHHRVGNLRRSNVALQRALELKPDLQGKILN